MSQEFFFMLLYSALRVAYYWRCLLSTRTPAVEARSGGRRSLFNVHAHFDHGHPSPACCDTQQLTVTDSLTYRQPCDVYL